MKRIRRHPKSLPIINQSDRSTFASAPLSSTNTEIGKTAERSNPTNQLASRNNSNYFVETQDCYHIERMSDNEKGAEGSTSKETEWDLLSLSSSTYTEKEPLTESLFMPGHFVFPPNEHENLPIEPEPEVERELEVEQAEEQLRGSIEYLSSPEGIKFYEEGQRVTFHDFDDEETGNSLVDDDSMKNDGDMQKPLPCEAWWKRHAICLYKNVKEANTIWSVLVATALMGLVILGQRWHKEKFQINSRWRYYINNEMARKILGSKR